MLRKTILIAGQAMMEGAGADALRDFPPIAPKMRGDYLAQENFSVRSSGNQISDLHQDL